MSHELHDTVPPLFVYEYPHIEGAPLGVIEPDEDLLKNPDAMAISRECVCLFAVEHEECGVDIIGSVFQQYLCFDDDDQRWIHVLIFCGDTGHVYIKREDVANVLLNVGSTSFLQEHEEPWVDLLDVIVMFQYESDYRLAFLVDDITQRFLLNWDARGTVLRIGQMVFQCVERNYHRERQALRRALRKVLPQLLPGATIAQKKPGYALKNGHADFFLERHGKLIPTQLMTEPVSPYAVESLRKAITGYKAETGYFFAPGIAEGVVLDDNMIFVHFA
jgi:hypothetical protein